MENLKNLSDEFIEILHDMYGIYADSRMSYHQYLQGLKKEQMNMSIDKLDRVTITHANGNPTNPNAVILNECTQKEFIERMHKNGTNLNFISKFMLVMIYEYWENKYRKLFTEVLKVEKKDFKSDIFGDIRLIRHGILNSRGIATKNNAGKTKIITAFKHGTQIHIDYKLFQSILVEIFKFINNLFTYFYEEEDYPDHSLSLAGRNRHRNTKHTIN